MKTIVARRLLTCLAGAALAAQPPAAPKQAVPEPDDKTRIVLDVTRVNMLFTVSDKKGRFITNLAKDDFQVFEGKKQQNILEFTAETDLPLRLAILIDTSNSIRDRFRFEQEAAIEFINSLLRPEAGQGRGGQLRHHRGTGGGPDERPGETGQVDPRPAPGRRHVALRRDLLRLPRQADAGPAAAQVPPRHGGRSATATTTRAATRATRRWKWRRRPTW